MIRRVSLFIPFFLCLLLSDLSFATSPDSINVLVVDENDAPVGGVVVSIQGQQTFTSKSDGSYTLVTTKKLVLPLTANIIKKGYEIDELIYNNSEIEVRIRKIQEKNKTIQLTLLSADGKLLKGVKAKYLKREYISDGKGLINVAEKSFDEKQLSVAGFKITHVKSDKGQFYSIALKPEVINESTKEVVVANENGKSEPHISSGTSEQTVDASGEQVTAVNGDVRKELEPKVSEEVFIQYQKDFDALSQEVVRERERILESNRKIREEIERATTKLKNEKNLTPAQREQLRKSIDKLEGELIENSIAYNKADQKTLQLINNLKLVVIKKDSINAATIKQLKVEQKKVVLAERKHKRTIIIFTIISVSLVLLAVVFYSIARKMKNHKVELLKVTEELSHLKKEIAELNN